MSLCRLRPHEAFEALLPDDIVLRHEWLFAQQWVPESAEELADHDVDFQKHEERIRELRESTLREIWSLTGYEGIARLCELSEAPYMIGWHLASGVFDIKDAEQFAADVIGCESSSRSLKAGTLSFGFARKDGQVGARDDSGRCDQRFSKKSPL